VLRPPRARNQQPRDPIARMRRRLTERREERVTHMLALGRTGRNANILNRLQE